MTTRISSHDEVPNLLTDVHTMQVAEQLQSERFVGTDATLAEVLGILLELGVGSVYRRSPEGIISLRDVVRAISEGATSEMSVSTLWSDSLYAVHYVVEDGEVGSLDNLPLKSYIGVTLGDALQELWERDVRQIGVFVNDVLYAELTRRALIKVLGRFARTVSEPSVNARCAIELLASLNLRQAASTLAGTIEFTGAIEELAALAEEVSTQQLLVKHVTVKPSSQAGMYITASTGVTIREVLSQLLQSRRGCVYVLDEYGRLLRIITERDVARWCANEFCAHRSLDLDLTVEDAGIGTTEEIRSVQPGDLAQKALEYLAECDYHQVPVLVSGFFYGHCGLTWALQVILECWRRDILTRYPHPRNRRKTLPGDSEESTEGS